MSLIERLLTELLPLKGCRSHPETQSGTAQSSGVKVGLHPGPAVWPPAECPLPQCRTRPRRNGVRVPAGLVGRAGPPVPRHVPARQREPSSPGNAGHCQPVGGRVGRWVGPAPASSGGPPSPVQRDDPPPSPGRGARAVRPDAGPAQSLRCAALCPVPQPPGRAGHQGTEPRLQERSPRGRDEGCGHWRRRRWGADGTSEAETGLAGRETKRP